MRGDAGLPDAKQHRAAADVATMQEGWMGPWMGKVHDCTAGAVVAAWQTSKGSHGPWLL